MLNHTAGVQAQQADANVTMTRDTLNGIILVQTRMADAVKNGSAKVGGNQAKLDERTSGRAGQLPRYLRVLVQYRDAVVACVPAV